MKIALSFSPQDSKSSPNLNRDKNHGYGRDDLTDPQARFNPSVLFFALRFQTTSQNPNLLSFFPPWPHTETSISTPRQSSLSRTGSPNRSRWNRWFTFCAILWVPTFFFLKFKFLVFDFGDDWWSCEASVESSDRLQVDKGEQRSSSFKHREEELQC